MKKKDPWFRQWKKVIGIAAGGTALTVSLLSFYAYGNAFDPSTVAERQLHQNQVLFPEETSTANRDAQESGGVAESPEDAGDAVQQPKLFDEKPLPQPEEHMELLFAEVKQERAETQEDRTDPEPRRELPSNVYTIEPLEATRVDDDTEVTVEVTKKKDPEEQKDKAEDGSGRTNPGAIDRTDTDAERPGITPVPVPQGEEQEPQVQPKGQSEPGNQPVDPRRHASVKDVNDVPNTHTSKHWLQREYEEFTEDGTTLEDGNQLSISVGTRDASIAEESYRLVYGEPVTPEKIIMSTDIWIQKESEGVPNSEKTLALWSDNDNVEFKDYPETATEDFIVKCRVRANKDSEWTDWTDVEVPVYDERLVLKFRDSDQNWKETKSLFLHAGDSIPMMWAYNFAPFSDGDVSGYLSGEYGLGKEMFVGWSEGYDYYEEADGDYVRRDVIEHPLTEDTIIAEKNGGRRVFYGEMMHVPDYMKIKLRKQAGGARVSGIDMGEYYQTLEWIWWSKLPSTKGLHYMSELDVPEGIHAVALMRNDTDNEMIKGVNPTQVEILRLPSTVRSVDFTNLVVHESFEVSPDNPWLHASADGKQLLNAENEVVGKVQNVAASSQKIIFRLPDASGAWNNWKEVWLSEGETFTLSSVGQWLAIANNAPILVGWKADSPDGPFFTEELIRIDEIGEPRIFYGVMGPKPNYMKVVQHRNGRGFQKVLEWIWWKDYPDQLLGEHYLNVLDVPEGIDAIRIMAQYNHSQMQKSENPTRVNVLRIPFTVQSVDFTNLVVYDHFEVSSENRWLTVSEDGKTLMDANGNTIGTVTEKDATESDEVAASAAIQGLDVLE